MVGMYGHLNPIVTSDNYQGGGRTRRIGEANYGGVLFFSTADCESPYTSFYVHFVLNKVTLRQPLLTAEGAKFS